MAETLKGKAAIWGVGAITGTNAAAAVILTGTVCKVQSMDFTRDSDVEQLSDEDGEVIGECFFNEKQVINISVIPSAASVADARTNATALLPATGSTLTIVDPETTVVDGAYNILSSRNGRTNKGFATIELSLRKYNANDVTTAIS